MNTPIPAASPIQFTTIIADLPLQSLPPISDNPHLSPPHIIPDDNNIRFPTIRNIVSGIPDGFCLSTNLFGHSADITLPLKGSHNILGISLALNPDNDHIILKECLPYTPAGHIPRWRSTIRDSTVIAVNNIPRPPLPTSSLQLPPPAYAKTSRYPSPLLLRNESTPVQKRTFLRYTLNNSTL